MTTGRAMNGSSSVAKESTTTRNGSPPPGMRPEASAIGIIITNAIIGPGTEELLCAVERRVEESAIDRVAICPDHHRQDCDGEGCCEYPVSH